MIDFNLLLNYQFSILAIGKDQHYLPTTTVLTMLIKVQLCDTFVIFISHLDLWIKYYTISKKTCAARWDGVKKQEVKMDKNRNAK